jgi:predicted metal-dependent HD superfamily phosphohydrolase
MEFGQKVTASDPRLAPAGASHLAPNEERLPRMTESVIEKFWDLIAARHDAEAFQTLDAAYREPQRAYHAWGHIADLLAKLESLRPLATRPDLIAAAIFWHDSVYLTRGPDDRPRTDPENVRASAALFARHEKFQPLEAQAVHDMIMATSSHMKARATQVHYEGFARDLDFFLDLDLSSLAAPWAVFEQNLDDIHFEYGWVPKRAFYLGRVQMLKSFLAAGDRLYRLPETRALWLSQARANLQQADADLRARLAREAPSS